MWKEMFEGSVAWLFMNTARPLRNLIPLAVLLCCKGGLCLQTDRLWRIWRILQMEIPKVLAVKLSFQLVGVVCEDELAHTSYSGRAKNYSPSKSHEAPENNLDNGLVMR